MKHKNEYSNVISRLAKPTIFGFLLLTGLAGSASAQAYIKPHTPVRTAQTVQHGWVGGQPSDLEYVVEEVTFLTTPCGPGSVKEILTGAEIKITVDWKLAPGPFGVKCRQAEAQNFEADDDSIVIIYNHQGFRWNFAGLVGPGAFVTGTGGFDSGVKITPPAAFELGWTGKLTYTLTLNYIPTQFDPCIPETLDLKGHYLHTYDGDFHVSVAPAVQALTFFPWSLIVGPAFVGITNDHAWANALNGGNLGTITTYTAPDDTVSRQACCVIPGAGIGHDDDEPRHALSPENDLTSPIGLGHQRPLLVDCDDGELGGPGSEEISGVAYIQFDVLGEGGQIMQSETTEFDPPCFLGCVGFLNIQLPTTYDGESLTVVGQIVDVQGNIALFEVPYDIADPLPSIKGLLSGTAGDSEAIHLDPNIVGGSYGLEFEVFDGFVELDESYVSSHVSVHLLDESGQEVDQVNGSTGLTFSPLGGGRYSTTINVVEGGTNDLFDNTLNVAAGQEIHAIYQPLSNVEVEKIFFVSPSADAIQPYQAEQRPGLNTEFGGASLGGMVQFDINGVEVSAWCPPGQTGSAAASTIAEAIDAAAIPGVTVFQDANGGVRIEGGDRVFVHEITNRLYPRVGLPMPILVPNGTPNSTGSASTIGYLGVPSRSQNDFTLTVDGLPPNQMGIFITSPDSANIPLGNGILGLGFNTLGYIIRLDVRSSGPSGTVSAPLDLQEQFGGGVEFLPGENWFVQFWHRDNAAGGALFDFSPSMDVIVHP